MSAPNSSRRAAGGDGAHAALLKLLSTSGYIDERYERLCAERGITLEQFRILCVLLEQHPGACSKTRVIERSRKTGSDLSRLFDRLERRRLIERQRDPRDRRAVVCRLTEHGVRLLRDMDPLVGALHEELAQRLSAARKRELIRLTTTLVGEQDQ